MTISVIHLLQAFSVAIFPTHCVAFDKISTDVEHHATAEPVVYLSSLCIKLVFLTLFYDTSIEGMETVQVTPLRTLASSP